MSFTYEQRRRPAIADRQPSPAMQGRTSQGPDDAALLRGYTRPTAAQKGRPIDLDAAIKARMENAFGDLSAVKLYESQAVGDAGAEAVAQGNEIAFAPGMADFSSRTGQERLGHELSHVMSQRSGLVRGQGFLANDSLEARADREGAMAAAGEQVYSGPVTHALSGASPAPAAAGPMQAKCGKKQVKQAKQAMQVQKDRKRRGKRGADDENAILEQVQQESRNYDPDHIIREGDDSPLNQGFVARRPKKGRKKLSPAPKKRSGADYTADFELLNSGGGSAEERSRAYDNIAVNTGKNMTESQKKAISSYMGGSEPINSFLRNEVSSPYYPGKRDVPKVQQEIQNISQGLKNNPLQGNISTYKGITDKYLAMMFQQFGLKEALNEDGGVNHEWMGKNPELMKKMLVGKTFRDEGYTSTTTEPDFARGWARKKARSEHTLDLMMKGKGKEAMDYESEVNEHPEKIKGAHMVRFNLPKGANASFVDRAGDSKSSGRYEQREVLADKGSSFRISDFRKLEDSDSYELVMDMLAEEAGKKREEE